MRTYSEVTQRTFEEEKAVYFRNLYQSSFYVAHGATILDIFCDSTGKLVFVFPREEHEKLIKLWMENKKETGGGNDANQ